MIVKIKTIEVLAVIQAALFAIPSASTSLPLPYRILYEFEEPTWIENIAIRANGALLLTVLSPNASLYEVSSPSSSNPTVTLVHSFPQANGLFGIAETSADVFAIVASNFSGPEVYANGTTVVFTVNFNCPCGPSVKVITKMPEVMGPNGMTVLQHIPSTVLIADSVKGVVWRLDTLTGNYDIALQAAQMSVIPGAALGVGIKGLHTFDDYLYFVNSGNAVLYRIRLSAWGLAARNSTVESVASLDAVSLDDFTFGRTWKDQAVLYVTTDKASAKTNSSNATEGGKVVAIDTKGF